MCKFSILKREREGGGGEREREKESYDVSGSLVHVHTL